MYGEGCEMTIAKSWRNLAILLTNIFEATLISYIIFISSNHPVGNTVANAERIRAFETYMILQYNK